jgi:hypothetical protein
MTASSAAVEVRRIGRMAVLVLLGGLLAPPVIPASAETDELQDVLGGFEEEEEEVFAAPDEPMPETRPDEVRRWDVTGSVSLASSINYLEHRSATGTDYTGVQKLRARLNLQLDLDLPRSWKARFAGYGFYDVAYRIQGRDDYTDDVLDEYEWEVDSQEMYLRGELIHDLDLKVGRQIVNWGRSDTVRVLDVLNPLDNREPGLADIEDLRLPVTMTRLDYYWDAWSFTAIAIPEIRFDKTPPVGSDFLPVAEALPPEEEPGTSFDNTEWAGAAMGIFEGWDVSLHAARYWNDSPHVAPGRPTAENPLGLVRKHSRLTLAGSGGNYTIGSWLFKAEVAYIDGIDYTVTERVRQTPLGPVSVLGTVEKSRLDAMGGIEYYGFTDTTITLEVANRHINDFEPRMREFEAQHNALETTLRINADFLNARLRTTALGVVFGERAQDGSVVRLQADYDLRDALVVTGGILLFQNGDPFLFSDIDDNDRIFLEVKYSF